jgi:hypothetical protein
MVAATSSTHLGVTKLLFKYLLKIGGASETIDRLANELITEVIKSIEY